MSGLRAIGRVLLLATAGLLAACGGGGGGGAPGPTTPSAPNVLAMRINGGTDGSAFNIPFVTVTVCQPSGSPCVDVPNVLVDTGSQGLRITASALAGLALPAVQAGANLLGQCGQFASGFTWGSVRRATVRLGGDTTSSPVSMQVIADPAANFANVPAGCAAVGGNLGAGLGALGILGVGLFDQDCDAACVNSAAPNVYYSCSAASACSSVQVQLANQVRNPVAALPVNNNGVVLQLPPVPPGGVNTLEGTLLLGVGTQANNQIANASIVRTDTSGRFTTVYRGTTYADSFLDSGSNGLFFNDGTLPTCGDFYCPASPLALTASIQPPVGAARNVSLQVDSVLVVSTQRAANVAGPAGPAGTFIWGLPFHFGRTVYVVRRGATAAGTAGPYWAW